MLVLNIVLPTALLVFGICWYLHIVRVAAGKSKNMNSLVGLLLFYGPLFGLIIPVFIMSGASLGFVSLGVIISAPVSTMMFTTAVVKKYDGIVVIAFMTVNLAILGGLMLLA